MSMGPSRVKPKAVTRTFARICFFASQSMMIDEGINSDVVGDRLTDLKFVQPITKCSSSILPCSTEHPVTV
jgi:hypothetical protein